MFVVVVDMLQCDSCRVWPQIAPDHPVQLVYISKR
jgi:hypothetical protein